MWTLATYLSATVKGVEAHGIIQVVGGKMGVGHRLLDIVMTEDPLQGQDIATSHHEVTGERVPQGMSSLPSRQAWRDGFNAIPHG